MIRKMLVVLLMAATLLISVPLVHAEPPPTNTASANLYIREYWIHKINGLENNSKEFMDRTEITVTGEDGETYFVSVVGNRFRIRSQGNVKPTTYSTELKYLAVKDYYGEAISTVTISPDGKFADSIGGEYMMPVRYNEKYRVFTMAHIIGWRDAMPPNTNLYVSSVTGGWKITLSATDDFTGPIKTEYRINQGTWITYTQPFILPAEGAPLLEYRSTDQSGNAEQIRVRQF